MLNELSKESRVYNEQSIIFDTLVRHFENVYFVDLENKTAKILKLNADYVDVPGKVGHQQFLFDDVINRWIKTIVHKDDRDKLKSLFNIDYVNKFFETKDELVGTYRSIGNNEVHYFQFNISKASKDGKIAILGFQNIDDIIKEHQEIEKAKREKELMHQKEVNEHLKIISALSKGFRNVFVANMEEGTARVIRLADDYNVKVVRDVEKISFDFDTIVEKWVKENVHPDDKAKVKKQLNVKNLKNVFSKKDEYVGRYRSIENGVLHYYQIDCRKIDNTNNVVVGFQLIDKIIEDQKEAQKREMVLHEARIKEEKERLEVINSLSTIYSTIFQANIITHEYEVLTSISRMATVIQNKGYFDDVKEILIDTFVDKEYKNSFREFLDFNTLSSRLKQVNTIYFDYKDSQGSWLQARFITKRKDEFGNLVEVLYVARDVTEEKLTKYQAEHDSLTGLLNRGSFDQILKSIEYEKRNFALILVDVDKFKTINDTYGHFAGDSILKDVAKTLAKSFRSIDYVFRFGGDEFAIIAMDLYKESEDLIKDKMNHINEKLQAKETLTSKISLSAGVAFYDSTNPRDNLLNDADEALYYVKRNGRKGCHVFASCNIKDESK